MDARYVSSIMSLTAEGSTLCEGRLGPARARARARARG